MVVQRRGQLLLRDSTVLVLRGRSKIGGPLILDNNCDQLSAIWAFGLAAMLRPIGQLSSVDSLKPCNGKGGIR